MDVQPFHRDKTTAAIIRLLRLPILIFLLASLGGR
jgi:hypothetical protein